MFNWNERRIAMRSIPPTPKESKETKQRSALVVKEVTSSTKISEKVEPLLEESKGVVQMSYRKDYRLLEIYII